MLGLIGALALTEQLLSFDRENKTVCYREIAKSLLDTYSKTLVALDDEQAAPLYIFLKAAHMLGWNDEGKCVVEAIYADAAFRSGAFNRLDSDGEGALEHFLTISKSQFCGSRRMHANPTSLLPIIFLGGIWFGCSQEWDLRVFDRKNIGLFFPNDYLEFNQNVMCHGQTHTWQIGFGIWHVEEFAAEFRNIICSRTDDTSLSPEAHVLCMLSAMLYPNRIPLNLEALGNGTPLLP
jgi:hypothetical protein